MTISKCSAWKSTWNISIALIAASIGNYSVSSSAGEIIGPSPWNNEDAVIVLDAFQENWVDIPLVSKDAHHPIALVWQITKGRSQAVSTPCNKTPALVTKDCLFDKMYSSATSNNFLFGAYHFGHTGHVEEQADEFIKAVKPLSLKFVALDVDGDADGVNMTIPEAEIFLKRVHDGLTVWPVLYTTRSVATKISKDFDKSSVFANAPLWIAAPAWAPVLTLPAISSKVWDKYTLWQFNDDALCVPAQRKKEQAKHPHKPLPPCPIHIGGMDGGTDVNVFNGSADELKALFSK